MYILIYMHINMFLHLNVHSRIHTSTHIYMRTLFPGWQRKTIQVFVHDLADHYYHRAATQLNTLQNTAKYCNIMQHTPTRCKTLQRTPTHLSKLSWNRTNMQVFVHDLADHYCHRYFCKFSIYIHTHIHTHTNVYM